MADNSNQTQTPADPNAQLLNYYLSLGMLNPGASDVAQSYGGQTQSGPGAQQSIGQAGTAGANDTIGGAAAAAAPAAAINPLLGAGIAGAAGIAQGIGNILGSKAQTNIQKGALKQQEMTANTEEANTIARQMQLSPLRDKANYALTARTGMPTAQFNPLNYGAAGNSTPNLGGIDQNALNQKLAAYTPGAGGSGTTDAVNQAILTRLGYGTPGQRTGQSNLGLADLHQTTMPGAFNTNPAPTAAPPGPPTAATNPTAPGSNPFSWQPGGQRPVGKSPYGYSPLSGLGGGY
jgi:hypothetical protein